MHDYITLSPKHNMTPEPKLEVQQSTSQNVLRGYQG